jgi:serine protease Do
MQMAVYVEPTTVEAESARPRSSQISDELAALWARVSASVVEVRGSRNGAGSGVIWDGRGLVVTNAHVVPGDWAEVQLATGARLRARVTGRSRHLDLASLQIEPPIPVEGLLPAEIGDSGRLNVGELVVAVGNPLGERNAITLGIVGGTGPAHWPDGPRDVLRLAITLRPGNSGGALADVYGRIVGIPHMVVGSGLALAVPSRVVSRFLSGEFTA